VTEENYENPQSGQPVSWLRLNPGPPDNEAGIVTTTPRLSIRRRRRRNL
jgi:hypothetical protein